MQWLKHYFAFDRRMNRQPFLVVTLIYIVLGTLSSMLVVGTINPQHMHELMESVKLEQAGKITHEEAAAKKAEIQTQMQNETPLSSYVIAIALVLLVLPALAMRLKDLGYAPALALLLLIPTPLSLYYRLTQTVPNTALLIGIGIFILIAKSLLCLVRGTKGENRYGPDPLGAA